MSQYRCEHFSIQELVPPKVHADRGDKAWELLDERALITLDKLRKQFGSMTVNSWAFGGDRKWSGLRTEDSPYYSPYSQHAFGRAFDVLFAKATADEVRRWILANDHLQSTAHITALEMGVSWLHFDVRNTKRFKLFNA